MTLKTVFTSVAGLYTNVSTRFSLALSSSGDNRPYDCFRNSNTSYMLHYIVSVIGFCSVCRYSSSIAVTSCLRKVKSTACISLYWHLNSSCSSFCVVMSVAVKGSGPVSPRVDTPTFCIGTNKHGSVGRVNGAAPWILLYSAVVKYKLKYPSCPPP